MKRIFVVALIGILAATSAQLSTAAPKKSIAITFEVVQKYPGVDSPGNVLSGCREGFLVDQDFTGEARWEILGSSRNLLATGGVSKVGVKNLRKNPAPYHTEDEEDGLPYIFSGTCTYTAKMSVPKSEAYRFFFANIDLKTSHSYSELEKNKWKILITTDLNCGGLYGKKCTYKSYLGNNRPPSQKAVTSATKVSITARPIITLSFTGQVLTASIAVSSEVKDSSSGITGIKARLFQGYNSLLTKDSIAELKGNESTINFTFDLSGIWKTIGSQGLPLRFQAEYYGSSGSGESVLKEISLP